MNKKLLTAGVLASALMVPLTGCQNLVQNDPVTCKVTDKDRSTEVVDGSSKSVFRIYTDCPGDNATLGLGDNPLKGQWNSSDLYGQIQKDKTYKFYTTGYRNGFLSSFREIYQIEEVPEQQPQVVK